jgi:hypothetical protein
MPAATAHVQRPVRPGLLDLRQQRHRGGQDEDRDHVPPKTIFEPSPQAALRLLLAVPFEVMRGYWSTIICAAESRMDFTMAVDRFKGELRSLFSSFRYGDADQPAFFPAPRGT